VFFFPLGRPIEILHACHLCIHATFLANHTFLDFIKSVNKELNLELYLAMKTLLMLAKKSL
jgi:hypothetical protein